jgi:hypothetical protein
MDKRVAQYHTIFRSKRIRARRPGLQRRAALLRQRRLQLTMKGTGSRTRANSVGANAAWHNVGVGVPKKGVRGAGHGGARACARLWEGGLKTEN